MLIVGRIKGRMGRLVFRLRFRHFDLLGMDAAGL